MLVAFLVASEVALLAASVALLLVWDEPGLSWLAGGLASVCALAVGFAAHSTLVKVLGAAAIAAWLIQLGRPRKRRRIKRALGAKSAAAHHHHQRPVISLPGPPGRPRPVFTSSPAGRSTTTCCRGPPGPCQITVAQPA
jgi:hypothetical protein